VNLVVKIVKVVKVVELIVKSGFPKQLFSKTAFQNGFLKQLSKTAFKK